MYVFKNTISTFPFRFQRHNVITENGQIPRQFSNRDRGFAEKFSNEEMSARSALLCDKRSRDSDYSESGRVPAPFVIRVCLINSHRIYSVTIIREQRGQEYDEHEEKASVAVSWRAPRANGPTVFKHLRPRLRKQEQCLAEPLRDP